MFWNGEVPFNMDGPWFVGMSKERDESLMDDIGIIPQFDVAYEGETYKPNPTNYPLVTMISKNCEHPDEAYAFLEWMTTDEAQALIADCGMIPSNTDYSTSDEYIKAAVDAVKKLSADVGIPADLKEIVKEEDVQFLSESAYADACRPGNPRDTSVEEIAALYRSLL